LVGKRVRVLATVGGEPSALSGKGGNLRRSRRYADSIYVSQCENLRNRFIDF
jgi:hypothetical protein